MCRFRKYQFLETAAKLCLTWLCEAASPPLCQPSKRLQTPFLALNLYPSLLVWFYLKLELNIPLLSIPSHSQSGVKAVKCSLSPTGKTRGLKFKNLVGSMFHTVLGEKSIF